MPPQKPVPVSSEGLGPEGLNAFAPIPHDETGNRDLNTTYQNKTGKTMIVLAQVDLLTPLPTDSATIQAMTNDTADFGSVNPIGCALNPGVQAADVIFTITLIVPPNWFYTLNSVLGGSGNALAANWYEVY